MENRAPEIPVSTKIQPEVQKNTQSSPVPQTNKPLIIGLVVIVLLLLGSTGYLAYQNYQLRQQIALSPTPTSPSPSPTADPTAGWKTYTDDVAGVSFRYPEAWEISDVEPAKTARILNLSSDYYRAIEFIFGNNPARLSPRDLANQQLARAHYGEVSSTFQIEPFEAANASGVKITGFPYGILMTVVLNHNEVTLTVSLIEGGEIGGSPAASFPTALEDEKLILQILDTLDFSASP